MIEEDEAASIDFGALRYAIERADPDLLLGFYAEDAELRIVHAGLPEGKAFELGGRAQIKRYLHAVCEQKVECTVEGGALHGEGSILFVEACRYPDGRGPGRDDAGGCARPDRAPDRLGKACPE